MVSIIAGTVIISKDGTLTGKATGRTRNCGIDCPTHSIACEVVWETLGIQWPCMGTLMWLCDLPVPTYQVISVADGIDYLGSHKEDDGGVVTEDPAALYVGYLVQIFGASIIDPPQAPDTRNIEYIEFDRGDRDDQDTPFDPRIAGWVDEAQTIKVKPFGQK